MDKAKKVYISGGITNVENYREVFTAKENELAAEGYTVLSPLFIKASLSWKDYMRIDLTMVRIADCVYMLEGWEESRGARIEQFYAEMLQKEIIYE